MKPRSCALLLLALLLACDAEPHTSPGPAPAPPPSESPASKTPPVAESPTPSPLVPYLGRFTSKRMTLTLVATGNDTLKGELKIGSRPPAPALATLAEGGLRGEFTVGETALPFRATLDADGLVFTADGKDYRLERTPIGPPEAPPPLPTDPAEAPSDEAEALDEALLGLWIQGDPLTEAADEARFTFSFKSDGSYRYGRSQSADGSVIAGQVATGSVITGRWRTKDGALLTLPRGGVGWVRYAAYAQDTDRLTLTYANGDQVQFFKR